jgi:metallo-beta-lactamase family protein
VIPVFAIERTQELMYYLSRMLHDGRIPKVDVFLDSPMAAKATKVFGNHHDMFDAETNERIANGDQPFRFPGLKIVGTTAESKALNDRRKPAVIMATSGMCVGGRIKHHLRHNITRPESTIVFVGYQGRGTLGRQIVEGSQEVRIHGMQWPVRAKIVQIHGFSGHADRSGLLRWLSHFQTPPQQLFLVHGEAESSAALADQVRREKGWQVTVPEYRQTIDLA